MDPKRMVVICVLAVMTAGPAFAQSKWTLAGNAGLSYGDQTDASLAWWGSLHRWITPTRGLGIEAGRFRWEGIGQSDDRVVASSSTYFPAFEGLARGSQELQYLSGSIMVRGAGVAIAAAPFISFSMGAYRQVIRTPDITSGTRDPRDGLVRPGWSIAIGGVATRGIAPGAEFRYDWVDTKPVRSNYFTASVGLNLNR